MIFTHKLTDAELAAAFNHVNAWPHVGPPPLLGDRIAKLLNPIARKLDKRFGTKLATCPACKRRQNLLNRFERTIKNYMRKFTLALSVLMLWLAGCQQVPAAVMHFALTNFNATLSTNAIKITPVRDRAMSDGVYLVTGLPITVPTTDGLCSVSLMAGNYSAQPVGSTYSRLIYFYSTADSGDYNMMDNLLSGVDMYVQSGVQRLIGGQNVSISPTNGKGNVTVSLANFTNSNTIWVDLNGSDANSGTTYALPKRTISNAVATATSGLIRVGPGVFVNNNTLQLAKNVSLVGSGMGVTTLINNISGSGTVCLAPGDNSLVADLTIRATNSSVSQIPFGITSSQSPATNFTLLHCDIYGNEDGGFFQTTTTKITGNWDDSPIHSKWDGITTDLPDNTSIIDVHNPSIDIRPAVLGSNAGDVAHGLSIFGGLIRVWDGSITTTNGPSTTEEYAVNCLSGNVEIHHTSITTSANGSPLYYNGGGIDVWGADNNTSYSGSVTFHAPTVSAGIAMLNGLGTNTTFKLKLDLTNDVSHNYIRATNDSIVMSNAQTGASLKLTNGAASFTNGSAWIVATNGNIKMSGDFTARHLISSGAAPTITSTGAGLGTGGSVTIAGHDTAFYILITPGTSPAADSVICRITFGTAFASAPFFSMTPSGHLADMLSGSSVPSLNTVNANYIDIKSGFVALNGAGSSYGYVFICIQ